MLFVPHHEKGGWAVVLFLCRTLCLCATWTQATRALPQGATESDVPLSSPLATFALIPSAPIEVTALIPSEPPRSEPALSGLIPSQPTPSNLIPSQPRPSGLIPSEPRPSGIIPSRPPTSGLIPSQPPPSGLIPSRPLPSGLIPSQPPRSSDIPSQLISSTPVPSGIIPSGPIPSNPGIIPSGTGVQIIPSHTFDPVTSISHGSGPTLTPSMALTDEPLRPIPAPTTAPGDPDGHHEITEPNLTATASCRGCSPVVEISVSGFLDWPTTPVAEHAGSSALPPTKATVTAGQSQLIISKEPTGSSFVVGNPTSSTTVTAGQTVVVDNTPIVIQTSAGNTEVVVGATETIPLKPVSPETAGNEVTEAPILAPVTIGSQTVTANAESQYIVADQTLQPGGPAITVDGHTISLMPSATALVVDGVTTTLAQAYGAIYTTTAAPTLLTFHNKVFTANRAGYYVLAPGTTLIPGGPPVTVSGTVISLEPRGTAAIIQGSTSVMTPVTTIVTLTRENPFGGPGWSTGGRGGGGNFAQSTNQPDSAGISSRMGASGGLEASIGGILLLWGLGFGWLAVWL